MSETLDSLHLANDAEASLLGAVLSGYSDIDELADLVDRSDFYLPANQATWDAILRVHQTSGRPDPVSVRLALDDSGSKHDPLRLLELTSLVPIVTQAPYYAQQVATASGLRRIQSAAQQVHQLASSPGDLDDIRERARAFVDDATRGRSTTQARTIADIMPAVIDTAQNGQAAVLGTGWPDLDRLIGGLAPGRLVLVGARPGVGKSVMGTNLALHFATHHKHAVLLASLEMPENEVVQRLLATQASVNLTGLQQGTSDERSWGQIAQNLDYLNSLPITINDSATQTVTNIRRQARDIQRKRDDLALIVVDYLQLVRPTDSRPNRAEQVTQISRDLKLLARETGACVVAMAQMNREAAKNTDGRPRLTDLREGGIENDADQVILMHQPDENIPELEVFVDKNRHGPKGVARLQIQGHYARLVSVEWRPGRTA